MSQHLDRYRQLESELRDVRQARGVGTHDEDYIVESMTLLWGALTEDEQKMLDAEGPVTFPDAGR